MPRAPTLVLAAALAVLLLVAYPPAARAARTSPASTSTTQTATHKVSPDEMGAAAEDHECEGVGEQQEECMARRTLAAHTDYIYTQEHHN